MSLPPVTADIWTSARGVSSAAEIARGGERPAAHGGESRQRAEPGRTLLSSTSYAPGPGDVHFFRRALRSIDLRRLSAGDEFGRPRRSSSSLRANSASAFSSAVGITAAAAAAGKPLAGSYVRTPATATAAAARRVQRRGARSGANTGAVELPVFNRGTSCPREAGAASGEKRASRRALRAESVAQSDRRRRFCAVCLTRRRFAAPFCDVSGSRRREVDVWIFLSR